MGWRYIDRDSRLSGELMRRTKVREESNFLLSAVGTVMLVFVYETAWLSPKRGESSNNLLISLPPPPS